MLTKGFDMMSPLKLSIVFVMIIRSHVMIISFHFKCDEHMFLSFNEHAREEGGVHLDTECTSVNINM